MNYKIIYKSVIKKKCDNNSDFVLPNKILERNSKFRIRLRNKAEGA